MFLYLPDILKLVNQTFISQNMEFAIQFTEEIWFFLTEKFICITVMSSKIGY